MKLDDMRSRRGPIMLGYLRKGFYQDSSRMLELLDTLGIEMDGAWGTFDDILDQCFVDRATWGLDIWEKELGLVPGPSDSDEIRRARIKAKLIGFGTFTEQIAQELANAYSRSGEARYLPLYDQYSFKTQYEDDDLISYAGLKSAFEEARPAHLKHLIGLFFDVNFPVEQFVAVRIKGHTPLGFDAAPVAKSKLRAMALILGFGLYDSMNGGLYFDGSWYFDGSQVFDGVARRDMDWYLAASIPCRIRTVLQGDIPILFEIDGDCKVHFKYEFDSGSESDARTVVKLKPTLSDMALITGLTRLKSHEEIRFALEIRTSCTACSHDFFPGGPELASGSVSTTTGWYLGVGEYDDIDPQVLIFNGWYFDGSQQFNGVNAQGLNLYYELAIPCAIRHIRNGQLIENT